MLITSPGSMVDSMFELMSCRWNWDGIHPCPCQSSVGLNTNQQQLGWTKTDFNSINLQIIKMKASGYFVGWNLSSIKSLASNYQTATVGRMEGWRVTLPSYLY